MLGSCATGDAILLKVVLASGATGDAAYCVVVMNGPKILWAEGLFWLGATAGFINNIA